jgi:hypothetical protein
MTVPRRVGQDCLKNESPSETDEEGPAMSQRLSAQCFALPQDGFGAGVGHHLESVPRRSGLDQLAFWRR